MRYYLQLLRINHWFKNIFIFVGVILYFILYPEPKSFDINTIVKVIIAFTLASTISSSNYIINQVTDINFDRQHPDKKNRPLPSGNVSVSIASILCIVIALVSFISSSFFFNRYFQITLGIFFLAGIVYNIRPIRLKDVPYIDVLSESFNNPIRFLLGWFIFTLNFPSLILLISTWSVGAFLMTAKRYDELLYYGRDLVPYRQTFKVYSISKLKFMMIFYLLLTILTLLFFAHLYLPSLYLFIIFFAAFLFWIARMVLSGKAKTRSVESFVVSKPFLSLSIVLILVYLLIQFL